MMEQVRAHVRLGATVTHLRTVAYAENFYKGGGGQQRNYKEYPFFVSVKRTLNFSTRVVGGLRCLASSVMILMRSGFHALNFFSFVAATRKILN